jgi:GNAT superfamily N-acetyltransferase
MRYEINRPVTPDQFVDILKRSGLAERRPVDDPDCISRMVTNANLIVTAWLGDILAGIARSVTDFSYCCYLSDLAVDRAHQKKGLGRELIARTQAELGPHCTVILLSAPAAVEYYPHIGMEKHLQAWVLPRNKSLRTRIHQSPAGDVLKAAPEE